MEETVYQTLKNLVRDWWEKFPLEDSYSEKRYRVPIESCPASEGLKRDIANCGSNLAQNLLLKKRLCAEMGNGVGEKDINFWIIRNWGGINMAASDRNQERIADFFNLLNERHESGLGRIASFSKVASFAVPRSWFVYDSRVAYSLNWLLRKAGATAGFFPFPPGRSKLAVQCDLKGVIASEKRSFVNGRIAYYEYCQLIKRLYRDICPDGKEPYRLEMLLFQAAPGKVFEEFHKEFKSTPIFHEKKTTSKVSPKKDVPKEKKEKPVGRGKVTKKTRLLYDSHELDVFVGYDKRNRYCELLHPHAKDRQEKNCQLLLDKLQDPGFKLKGGKSPYLIRKFRLNQNEEVEELYSRVLSRLQAGTDQ